VIATYGMGAAFSQDLALLTCVAEIRAGRDYADFFENLRATEQMEFAKHLAGLVKPPSDPSTALCVLDTGINRCHPLIEKSLAEADNLSIKADWSLAKSRSGDHQGEDALGLGAAHAFFR
jgi:hypothetical protein